MNDSFRWVGTGANDDVLVHVDVFVVVAIAEKVNTNELF